MSLYKSLPNSKHRAYIGALITELFILLNNMMIFISGRTFALCLDIRGFGLFLIPVTNHDHES